MILWLIISIICVVISTIGVVILHENEYKYQVAKILMIIFGYAIGLIILLYIIAFTAVYNEFIAQYNMIESYIENNTNPDKIIITNINSKLLEYQTKKQIYGVFSLYPDSVLNLEYIKVP